MKALETFAPSVLDKAQSVTEQIDQFTREQIGDILAGLLRLAKFAEGDAVRLEAYKTLLSYCAPPHSGKPERGASTTLPPLDGPRAGPLRLQDMNAEELNAVRTLQLGIVRRRDSSDE